MPVEFTDCVSIKNSESGKSLLVHIPDVDDEPMYVPHNQIHDDSDVYKPKQEGTLIVTDWWAEREGLV
jgi:hypothetical protein